MDAVYRQARERTSRALAWPGLLCLVLLISGCASVAPMVNLSEEDVTGSIVGPAPLSTPPQFPTLGKDDWIVAHAALASALDPQGIVATVPWENPLTGARGSMTPVGAVYEADGQTCRAFVAEIGGKAPARRLQGRGCLGADDQWAVSDLKPFGV